MHMPRFGGYISHAVVLTAGMLSLSNQPVQAGVVEKGNGFGMGCMATLSGTIVSGDLERVQEALSERPRYAGKLCLNSGGGSYHEGLRLAAWFREEYVATAIGRNAHCESACAIAFMGGTAFTESDIGDLPDRTLHPLGMLGFHAPRLVVPDGNYAKDNVSEAYDTAISSIEGLMRMASSIWFQQTLTVEMLATQPRYMRYIKTVGEASQWGIAISPVIERRQITINDIWRACANIDGFLLDKTPNVERGDDDGITASLNNGEFRAEVENGFRQEGATGCNISYAVANTSAYREFDWGGYASINDIWPLWAYQFYTPETPIKQIALKNDTVMEFGPQPDVSTTQDFNGRCVVLTLERIVDSDFCKMSRLLIRGDDLRVDRTDTYVWPSGARTVLTKLDRGKSNGDVRLNGVLVPNWWDDTDTNRAERAVRDIVDEGQKYRSRIGCFKNTESGNFFCFIDNIDVRTSQL